MVCHIWCVRLVTECRCSCSCHRCQTVLWTWGTVNVVVFTVIVLANFDTVNRGRRFTIITTITFCNNLVTTVCFVLCRCAFTTGVCTCLCTRTVARIWDICQPCFITFVHRCRSCCIGQTIIWTCGACDWTIRTVPVVFNH